ncbi:hypothetical protein KI387_002051, partial [Taxus chinensis]
MGRNRESSSFRYNAGAVKWQLQLQGRLKPQHLLLSLLIVFAAGILVGRIAGLDAYGIFRYRYRISVHLEEEEEEDWAAASSSCLRMVRRNPLSFLHPAAALLQHDMRDDELFCRALAVPSAEQVPLKRALPKIAFLFLANDSLPLLPLWEKFFSGHNGFYSIYVHSIRPHFSNLNSSSVFYGRAIRSRKVDWGGISMVDAERRLVGNALLDFSNEHFILLSETCIPLYNFSTVYNYLISSGRSHVESYDNPGHRSRGRYNKLMAPEITLFKWRKGSQWFDLQRQLALDFIADNKYYSVFKRLCKPTCYPDEHYLPTLLNIFERGSLNSNTSITWVDW